MPSGAATCSGTYVIDMVAMFMAMPIVLFPAFAETVLNEPKMLGLLYTAESVGTMLATLTSGWTTRFHHHGRAVVVASMCWGGAIALVGIAPNAWVAIVFLMFAGAADMISGIFRWTIWNQTIPDELRGRLAGIEMLSYSFGPMAGSARAGLVADADVRTHLDRQRRGAVRGRRRRHGTRLRDFWRYDAQTDEHALRERDLRAARAAAHNPDSPADPAAASRPRLVPEASRQQACTPTGATFRLPNVVNCRWPGRLLAARD